MRRALIVIALVAGCGTDHVEIRVSTSTKGVSFRTIDAPCACPREAPPTAGHCYYFTDAYREGEGPCDCDRSSCSSSARIERDGVVLATTTETSFAGDFGGATLILVGCGDDIVVQLPTSVPPPPTISVVKSGGGFDISWTSEPFVDLMRIKVGELGGEVCVVPPEPSTFTTRGGVGVQGSARAHVTALHVLPVLESDRGLVRRYSASSTVEQPLMP